MAERRGLAQIISFTITLNAFSFRVAGQSIKIKKKRKDKKKSDELAGERTKNASFSLNVMSYGQRET